MKEVSCPSPSNSKNIYLRLAVCLYCCISQHPSLFLFYSVVCYLCISPHPHSLSLCCLLSVSIPLHISLSLSIWCVSGCLSSSAFVCLCPCLSVFLSFLFIFSSPSLTPHSLALALVAGPLASCLVRSGLPGSPCPPPPCPHHGDLPSRLPFQTRFPLFCVFVGHHLWVLQSSGAHLGVIMGFCTLTQAPASERKREGKKREFGMRGRAGRMGGGTWEEVNCANSCLFIFLFLKEQTHD